MFIPFWEKLSSKNLNIPRNYGKVVVSAGQNIITIKKWCSWPLFSFEIWYPRKWLTLLYCTRKRTISHWKVEKNKTAGNAGTLVSSLGAGFSQWKERLHNEKSEHSLFSLTAESTQCLNQFHNCHSCPFSRVLYILGIMALRAALLFKALLYQGLGSRVW